MSSTTEVISHWNTLIESFQTSPQQFYTAVTQAIEKRQIPNARMDRIQWNESHLLSAKREYLRVHCNKDFYFAVCGAPFGTGFFVSWWLLEPPDGCLVSLFSGLPVLSAIVRWLIKPWTYYRIDTAMMFQTAAHSAVLEVIDSITTSHGIRGLTETERKPVMREFFQK
ncbi:MAG: hypothetical protein LC768_01935 [Acidobacteria bacterium]|nr:hypothetical protein [Acidobacteriota bacterium]MCA1637092.1 hypothetical protein [Acidobacteriota bacterium]